MVDPAVIFDMDGVLVNSVPALYDAYIEFLAMHGVAGHEAEFEELNGPRLPEIVAILRQRYGLPGMFEELMSIYRGKMECAYRTARMIDGMPALLHRLHRAGFILAVASSASREQVRQALEGAGVWGLFSVKLGSEDVERGKPAPDIYLEAKSRLGDRPMLVIEDSMQGLAAARAANLRTLHFSGALQPRTGVHSIDDSEQLARAIFRELLACQLVSRPTEFRLLPDPRTWTVTGDVDAAVTQIWKKATALSPHLFDGLVLCSTGYRSNRDCFEVTYQVVPYRYVFAAQRQPDLDLGLMALGVTARLADSSGRLVLAKRQAVTEYPDHWELVPAGSIDTPQQSHTPPDIVGQLLNELEEETSLARGRVKTVRPLAVIRDIEHGVMDLCFDIIVDGRLDDGSVCVGTEHSAVKVCAPSEVGQALADLSVVPTTRLLLALDS